MKSYWIRIILVAVLLRVFEPSGFALEEPLTGTEIRKIGHKVFENECSAKDECLMQWNEGEDFLSLGIGHFIWYPAGKNGPFEESFPELIGFIEASGQEIPDWLKAAALTGCPWGSREDFLADRQSPKAVELYQFLMETKPGQADFLVKSLDESFPEILQAASASQREHIKKQYERLVQSQQGVYVLVDYLNFKGAGVLITERYNGQGWGLLQVLSGMKGEGTRLDALEEFCKTAERLLTERVNNAPPERNEQRWLKGWKKRVRSYLEAGPANED